MREIIRVRERKRPMQLNTTESIDNGWMELPVTAYTGRSTDVS